MKHKKVVGCAETPVLGCVNEHTKKISVLGNFEINLFICTLDF